MTKHHVALFFAFIAATSCATVTTGTHETISVDSAPSGANATLGCDRGEAQQGVTPATFTIRRNAGNCTLELTKDGFERRRLLVEEGINGRYWANFAFAPLVPIGAYVSLSEDATSSDKTAGAAMLVTAAAGFLTDFITGAVHEHSVDGHTARRIEVTLKPVP